MKLVYSLLIIVPIIGVLIGLTFVIISATSNSGANADNGIDIVNSYENTDELIKKFPVNNPTSVEPGIERDIQNRLLTGFENWNRGFDAWKAWGNILYTKDSIYHVHGARLTLAEYQRAMYDSLMKITILMGAFRNMVICGEWTAIHYDTTNVRKNGQKIASSVMEFVKFKDYGEELGTRVVEGWGGVKNDQYSEMAELQSPERQVIEEKKLTDMKNYQIPDIEDLEKKYPILYPTVDKGNMAREIRNIILEGFDSWNKGFTEWSSWVDIAYKTDAFAVKGTQDHKSMSEYKSAMQADSTKNVKRIYFDNMLINYNWAAIHYRYNIDTNDETQKDAGDRMQFLRFEETDEGLKIGETWIK